MKSKTTGYGRRNILQQIFLTIFADSSILPFPAAIWSTFRLQTRFCFFLMALFLWSWSPVALCWADTPGYLISASYGIKSKIDLPQTFSNINESNKKFSFVDISNKVEALDVKINLVTHYYINIGFSHFRSNRLLRPTQITPSIRYCFTDEGGIKTEIYSLGMSRLFEVNPGIYLLIGFNCLRKYSEWKAVLHPQFYKYTAPAFSFDNKTVNWGIAPQLQSVIAIARHLYVSNTLTYRIMQESFFKDAGAIFDQAVSDKDATLGFVSFSVGLSYVL